MQQVLGDLKFVEIYIDDITIHSTTFEDHLNHIRIVFQRLKDANLKLNPGKCDWFADKIKLLGHVVGGGELQMDKSKVEAVKQIEYCRNVKEVQRFLGLCGYYRKFIKDFAKISRPLSNLTRKDIEFQFNDACKEAFDTLKTKMIEEPILQQPKQDREYLLFTDASGYAIGAILAQRDEEGREYVCAYASRTLNKHSLSVMP